VCKRYERCAVRNFLCDNANNKKERTAKVKGSSKTKMVVPGLLETKIQQGANLSRAILERHNEDTDFSLWNKVPKTYCAV
jgi:hypothetical protein